MAALNCTVRSVPARLCHAGERKFVYILAQIPPRPCCARISRGEVDTPALSGSQVGTCACLCRGSPGGAAETEPRGACPSSAPLGSPTASVGTWGLPPAQGAALVLVISLLLRCPLCPWPQTAPVLQHLGLSVVCESARPQSSCVSALCVFVTRLFLCSLEREVPGHERNGRAAAFCKPAMSSRRPRRYLVSALMLPWTPKSHLGMSPKRVTGKFTRASVPGHTRQRFSWY